MLFKKGGIRPLLHSALKSLDEVPELYKTFVWFIRQFMLMNFNEFIVNFDFDTDRGHDMLRDNRIENNHTIYRLCRRT